MPDTAMPVEAQERTPGAVFRAFISADVDPALAHDAAEEVRDRAGENIIAAVWASKDRLKTAMDARFDALERMIQSTQLESQSMQREMQREFSALRWMIGIGFILLGICIAIWTTTLG